MSLKDYSDAPLVVLRYYSSITRDSPASAARRTLYMSRSSAEGIQIAKFKAFINYNKFTLVDKLKMNHPVGARTDWTISNFTR